MNTDQAKQDTLRGCGILFIVIAVIAVMVNTCNKGTDNKEQPSTDHSEQNEKITAAEKLAILDEGTTIPKSDIKVIRINRLLSTLSKAYDASEDSIADLTYKTKTVLHDQYGIQTSSREILEDMNQALPPPQGMSFKDAVILYGMLKMREKQ